MNRFIVYALSISFLIFLSPLKGLSQAPVKKKNVLQKAHERKIDTCDFLPTDKGQFLSKVFSVDDTRTNRTHHWFFQLLDLDGEPINYARVKVSGYLKNDPSIKFRFMEPVFKLCSEGKYIVGFVKVKHSGVWVLDFVIDNFGEMDSITSEIEIGELIIN